MVDCITVTPDNRTGIQQLLDNNGSAATMLQCDGLPSLDHRRSQGECPCSSPGHHSRPPFPSLLESEEHRQSDLSVPYLHCFKIWHFHGRCRCCPEHVVDLDRALIGREQSRSQCKRSQVGPLPGRFASMEEIASIYYE